jgi:hypothetical protein
LFLIKLAAHERHAAHQERRPQIELVSADEPPQCVVEILRRRGHTATVGIEARAPARGRPSKFDLERDGFLDIDALQEANAGAFARLHRLPLPPDFTRSANSMSSSCTAAPSIVGTPAIWRTAG